MAKLIQQSTANDPLFFFLVLTSDHISPATGLSPTVTISKNGAAFASPSGAVTEIANGWYQVAGNATDTGTLGDILLHASVATADNCDVVAAQVVSFNPRNANLGLTNVSANVAQWNGSNVSAPATAGIPDVNTKNINNVAAATPGASGGILIAGTNAATTFNGTAASGATPATAGLTITGGAASTTSGGTSAAGIVVTGGAGAASTNGAAAGVTFTAGGTTTVSGNDGAIMTATGNGNGLTTAHAGTGKDFNATTSPPLQVNATQIAGSAVSTTAAQIGVNVVQYNAQTAATDANNLPKVDVEDINGSATAAQALNNSTNTICWGTCSSGSTTTAVVSTLNNPSSLTASGQLIGRTIIFLGSTSSGGVQAQASNITASTTGATPTITFSTMTTAPANGDKFAVL